MSAVQISNASDHPGISPITQSSPRPSSDKDDRTFLEKAQSAWSAFAATLTPDVKGTAILGAIVFGCSFIPVAGQIIDSVFLVVGILLLACAVISWIGTLAEGLAKPTVQEVVDKIFDLRAQNLADKGLPEDLRRPSLSPEQIKDHITTWLSKQNFEFHLTPEDVEQLKGTGLEEEAYLALIYYMDPNFLEIPIIPTCEILDTAEGVEFKLEDGQSCFLFEEHQPQ